MSRPPTISAIIPVHNGERYVSEAIRSVLSQTRPVTECIVVDNESTDGTADAVHAFGKEVTYIHQQDAGPSGARNRGADRASGNLLAFLDHDDVWLPDKLQRQLLELTTSGGTLALCATTVIDAEGRPLGEKHLQARTDLLVGMLTFDGTEIVSCSSTGLVWKDAFHRLGGFDLRLSASADWQLLFNVLIHGKLAYVDEPLALYRLHDSNMSRNIGILEHDMLYAFDKVFADPMLPRDLSDRRRTAYAQLYRMLAGSYGAAGSRGSALRMATRSMRSHPGVLIAALCRRARLVRR